MLAATLLAALVGCAGARRAPAVAANAADAVGIYAATLRDGEETTRFRAHVWSNPPDRLHVAVVPPIGGPALIVDAGAGRLAITDARAGVSWVGGGVEASRAMGRVIGIEIGPRAMVGALMSGLAPDAGTRIERRGAAPPSLPSRLLLVRGPASLELRLRRLRAIGRPTDGLGTGAPPPGTERRGLDALAVADRPLVEAAP